jgi:Domain of unknown function (DUF6487)
MADEPQSLNYRSNQPQRPPAPTCSKCGDRMQQGFTTTETGVFDASVARMIWIEGEMRRRWLRIRRLPKGPRYEVVAFRCPSCGLIEFYSPTG